MYVKIIKIKTLTINLQTHSTTEQIEANKTKPRKTMKLKYHHIRCITAENNKKLPN